MNIVTQTVAGVRARPGELIEPPGSLAEFEMRFRLCDVPGEDGLSLWDDLPADLDINLIWTVVELIFGDEGRLVPGLQRFNCIGYVVTEQPRADDANHYRTYSSEE